MSDSRFTNLDVLRSLAALAVCFYHFNRDDFVRAGPIAPLFHLGYLGVDVFFVISGFVIPLALARSSYRLSGLGRFLAARFCRLYPAYLASGLLTVLLWYASSRTNGFQGTAPHFTLAQVLGNLFLVCDFTKQSWFIPVYWTLGIEAQYYLLLALVFPLLASPRASVRRTTIGLWMLAPCVAGSGPTVFSWTALFALGVLAFQYRQRTISTVEFVVSLALAFGLHALSQDWKSAGVGLFTALAIGTLPPLRLPSLIWVGTISYSLYLVHVPVGGRIVNLAGRFAETWATRALAVGLALAVSLMAAYLAYRTIEAPSHRLARRVGAREKSAAAAGSVTPPA